MNVGVIGAGFVGLTLAAVLGSQKFSVIIVDSDAAKIEKIRQGSAPFYEAGIEDLLKSAQDRLKVTLSIKDCVEQCNVVFVAVNTPSKPDGGIDLDNIRDVSEKIGQSLSESDNKPVIVIKSTVVPGTSQKMKKVIEESSGKKSGSGFYIVTNPEFIREGNAINDTLCPHAIVLGGESTATSIVKDLYRTITNPDVPVIITNHATAEMIKYANNAFLATKITFINQISNICQTVPDVDVDEVASAIGTDPRIGGRFLNAGPGYGGTCLSKDLNALMSFASKRGHDPVFLNAVQEFNDSQVDGIISLISEALGGDMRGKKISILGVSFKENTDDIRESASVRLIKSISNSADVTLHDPAALENAKKTLGSNIKYADSASMALSGSDCAVIMTAWKEYAVLDNDDFDVMNNNAAIVDARRILSAKNLSARYYALGIGRDQV